MWSKIFAVHATSIRACLYRAKRIHFLLKCTDLLQVYFTTTGILLQVYGHRVIDDK